MPYLYGDSSDSGLDQDYLHFLKSFMKFATQVLLGEARIINAKSHSHLANESADQNRAYLDKLRRMIHKTIKDASDFIPLQSETHKAAQAIWASTETIIKDSIDNISSGVLGAKKTSTDTSLSEKGAMFQLLESFLKEQDIPETNNYFDLHLGSNKDSYAIRQTSWTQIGLETIFSIDGGRHTDFSKVAKISHFKQGIHIHAPSLSGIVKKSTKIKSHLLDDYHVVSFRTSKTSIALLFRSERHLDSNGFDLEIKRQGNIVKCASKSKGSASSTPFEVKIDDVPALIHLAEMIELRCASLTECKAEMLEATLNNDPIKHLKNSTGFLEQLVEHISPVIRSISERSLSEDELVLKKVLEDDKREEIFLSKKELLAQITDVPDELKHVFKPLGLGHIVPMLKKRNDDSQAALPTSQDPPTVINDELTNQYIEQERGIRVGTGDIVEDTILDADTAPPPESYEPKNSMLPEEAHKIVKDPNTVDEAIENIKDGE